MFYSYFSNNSISTDYLERVVKQFFTELFPVAYHHAVHTSSSNENLNGDFHLDYITCLFHTYDELQPFGEIPKKITKNLIHSLGAANTFLRSLKDAAVVLGSTEELNEEYLSQNCKLHLLKMTYCPDCKGISRKKIKTCTGYCLNIMRGCLSQYINSLDGPWSSFVGATERLAHLVKSKNGIEETIKSLDTKLSEAIMHAMENGPALEKKVIIIIDH